MGGDRCAGDFVLVVACGYLLASGDWSGLVPEGSSSELEMVQVLPAYGLRPKNTDRLSPAPHPCISLL